jgi:hypothetical protein
MKLSAPTAGKIFSGMNQSNPQVMDSTLSAARQSHVLIRIGKDREHCPLRSRK